MKYKTILEYNFIQERYWYTPKPLEKYLVNEWREVELGGHYGNMNYVLPVGTIITIDKMIGHYQGSHLEAQTGDKTLEFGISLEDLKFIGRSINATNNEE